MSASEFVAGDRVLHPRYGFGTVQSRQQRATGYAALGAERVRVEWDGGPVDVSSVLASNVEPTPSRQRDVEGDEA